MARYINENGSITINRSTDVFLRSPLSEILSSTSGVAGDVSLLGLIVGVKSVSCVVVLAEVGTDGAWEVIEAVIVGVVIVGVTVLVVVVVIGVVVVVGRVVGVLGYVVSGIGFSVKYWSISTFRLSHHSMLAVAAAMALELNSSGKSDVERNPSSWNQEL